MKYINAEMDLVKETSELMMEELDPTTYDGEHAIKYFTAEIHLKKSVDNVMDSAELEYIINYLSELSIRPVEVCVYEVGYIEIYWKSNGYQIASSKAEYIQLVMDFKMFLRKIQSPFFDIQMHYAFYFTNHTTSIEGISENVISYSPKFNQASFGSNKEIKLEERFIF
ncbi:MULTISPECIES: hypothetical protein [Lysinibacillus]|uniref:Uncharacterized protein n=1 Tax=Lysinibacillus fusiformis TaxID=28031 RepID=A0A1E4QZV8_9BACI|nr:MULTISPECIES: hypothetical protein [Lysinibacillus]ODV53741.1 hypothetical protein BG258_20385 [Lysinibacillus fusiformis]